MKSRQAWSSARGPEPTVAGKPKLQAILKYHVLPANLSSHDIVRVHTVKTLSGQSLYPSVLLDNSAIKMKNIYCRNGVIHVIDSVMLPSERAKT